MSNRGRVRSYNGWRGLSVLDTPRPLAAALNSHGYPTVLLPQPVGPRKNVCVHRLVALTFLGDAPFEGAVVRHLNDIKTDNRVENLAWGTVADNAADRLKNGRRWATRGETHGRAKVTEQDVRAIRRMRDEGEPCHVIAEMYGIDRSTVSMIHTRRIWGWLE